jgi:hypothetical protein
VTEDKPVKKTTDLLIEMDQKLDKILGIIANQDLLLKTLNNKFSKLNKPTTITTNTTENPTISNYQREFSDSVSDDEFVQINTDHFDAEIQKSNGKKVAVQQRIVYSDGKNICLANVQITGGTLKAPKKLKTNSMGKWLAALEPGEYVVSVNKSGNKNKQNIAISMNITIPESDKPIELPQLSQ